MVCPRRTIWKNGRTTEYRRFGAISRKQKQAVRSPPPLPSISYLITLNCWFVGIFRVRASHFRVIFNENVLVYGGFLAENQRFEIKVLCVTRSVYWMLSRAPDQAGAGYGGQGGGPVGSHEGLKNAAPDPARHMAAGRYACARDGFAWCGVAPCTVLSMYSDKMRCRRGSPYQKPWHWLL